MKHLNRLTCLLLSFALLLSLAACGGSSAGGDAESSASGAAVSSSEAESAPAEEASASASTSVAEEKQAIVYKVGLFPPAEGDSSVPEAVQSYCEAHQVELVSVPDVPASAQDAAKSLEQLAAEGCNVVVMPGANYADALSACAPQFPDLRFLAVGVSLEEIPANACCLGVQEEEAGFLAGYMSVILGYTDLAFLGEEASPSDARYGTGFLQGASCAAMEQGAMDNVKVEYATCPGLEDEAVAAAVGKWYQKGTQVVFAAEHFEAAAQAAAEAKALVIGADVGDEALDKAVSQGVLLTSTVTDPTAALVYALDAATVSGTWSALAGTEKRVGAEDGNELSKAVIGLSERTAWDFMFDQSDCAELVNQLAEHALYVTDESPEQQDLLLKLNRQTLS